MTVSPSETRPTADLSITDGSNTLEFHLANRNGQQNPAAWGLTTNPRSALRITQGGGGYDDMEMPFTSVVQNDFSGGRASKWTESDKSRYAGGVIDSARGEARCAPKATQGVVYTEYASATASGTTSTSHYADRMYASFTPSSNFTNPIVKIELNWYDNGGLGAGWICAGLYTHDAVNDRPSSSSHGAQVIKALEVAPGYRIYYFQITGSLTASTKYWIGFHHNYFYDNNNLDVYLKTGTSSGNRIVKYNYNSSTWTEVAANKTIAFSLFTSLPNRMHYIHYKGLLLAVTQTGDASAPRLFANGHYGMAKSNSSDKTLLNTDISLSSTDLTGKIIAIVEGPGYTELQNWRTIITNTQSGSNNSITVAPAWNIEHTTATMFVVLGCDTWQEITGHGLTAPVTGAPLVVNDVIYFPQGESVAMRRGRYASGWAWYDDGTNAASYLALVQNENGAMKVWKAKASAATVAEAPKNTTAWSSTSNLAFEADLVCGSTASKITNLLAAKVSGPMLPVVFKEDGFGAVGGEKATKIYDVYRTFPEAANLDNGRTALQKDVYLWFNLLEGLERYYDQRLDDTGPNRDEGMEMVERGPVVALCEYMSRVYAVVDGGLSGRSSVLCYNGYGWNQVHVGGYGQRFSNLAVQVIPGVENPDRLWVSNGADATWMPVSHNPEQQKAYEYYSGSTLTTGRIALGFRDIKKYWSKVQLFTRGISYTNGAGTYIGVEYRVDGGSWVGLTSATTDNQEITIINGTADVTGRYIEFRFTLYTTSSTKNTPVLEGYRVDGVVRVPVKDVLTFSALLLDGYTVDRNGTRTALTVEESYDRLRGWMNSSSTPQPLTFRYVHNLPDNVRGFIDSATLTPKEIVIGPTERKLTALLECAVVEI